MLNTTLNLDFSLDLGGFYILSILLQNRQTHQPKNRLGEISKFEIDDFGVDTEIQVLGVDSQNYQVISLGDVMSMKLKEGQNLDGGFNSVGKIVGILGQNNLSRIVVVDDKMEIRCIKYQFDQY